MDTPTLESAIEASHKALAAITKGDQGGYRPPAGRRHLPARATRPERPAA